MRTLSCIETIHEGFGGCEKQKKAAFAKAMAAKWSRRESNPGPEKIKPYVLHA